MREVPPICLTALPYLAPWRRRNTDAHATTCVAVLFLFNKLNGADFDTLDDDFVVIVSSQAVAILQNAVRSAHLHAEQARVYELLRSTTDIIGHNTDAGVHTGITRVLSEQLHVDETLMFIVRAARRCLQHHAQRLTASVSLLAHRKSQTLATLWRGRFKCLACLLSKSECQAVTRKTWCFGSRRLGMAWRSTPRILPQWPQQRVADSVHPQVLLQPRNPAKRSG